MQPDEMAVLLPRTFSPRVNWKDANSSALCLLLLSLSSKNASHRTAVIKMSGIEIAGLVLGAFPLLIYALESYREGAEVVGDWWQVERAYTKCKQDLKYHQLLFEGNIERFLLPLVVDDDELKQLMENPAGTAWEDPELEKKLQERLPKAYDTFLGVMVDINKLMESFKKALGVNNQKFHTRVTRVRKLSTDA
jgi:hypothetical protein